MSEYTIEIREYSKNPEAVDMALTQNYSFNMTFHMEKTQ